MSSSIDLKEIENWGGYFASANGYIIGKRGRALKGKITKDGYSEVVLSDGNRRRCVRVHILIADAFLPKSATTLVVNHLDGNKLNNKLPNLEWTTIAGNTIHAVRSGLIKARGKAPSMLTTVEFTEMKQMRDSGNSYKVIAKHLGLSTRADYIGEILSGRKLSSISGF